MNKKSVLIILPAIDFNEEEYLTVKSILAKNGLNLFIASDANNLCIGKNGLRVKADVSFYNVHNSNFSAIVFIGGSGVKNYWKNPKLFEIAHRFNSNKKLVAAICSAPVILANAGLLEDKEATCYTSDREELIAKGAIYRDASVVQSKNIITAQSAASSKEFAELITDKLKG